MAITIKSADVQTATQRFTGMVAQIERTTGKTKQAIRVQTLKAEHDLDRMCTELAAQLTTQLEWLHSNAGHHQFAAFEDRWLADLAIYEAACDAINQRYEQKEIAA